MVSESKVSIIFAVTFPLSITLFVVCSSFPSFLKNTHIINSFKKFFSHLSHYRALRGVPCAVVNPF